MSGARIYLAGDQPDSVAALRGILEEAGHQIVDDLGVQLIILQASSREAFPVYWQSLRDRLTQLAEQKSAQLTGRELFVPILGLSSVPEVRAAFLERGADVCLPFPVETGELRYQVDALMRLKVRFDRLTSATDEMSTVHKRLQQAYQRIDQELLLARKIQESFLPQSLPKLPGIRFAVHYRPCGRVGGDFYDVFRLDEHHVGFYIADAMGHGVPASLLTIYLKRGVRGKEIIGNEYRLLPPDEVLQRLNRDLIEQGLAEHPFVTMVYGLFDTRSGTLQYSRAGHPHPLYLPTEGEPVAWQSTGSLLGVFEAEFTTQSHALQPGDKVVVSTDGADSACVELKPNGCESLLDCASRHRDKSIQELIDTVAAELSGETKSRDDLTLFGLEVGA